MRTQGRELVQHAPARTPAFAHADDAAAADRDAGLANTRDRVEPLGVRARRDDAAVELGRGVEVVVVGRASGLRERVGLRLRQHAERAAGFHAERANASHHRQHAIEFFALGRISPCGAHAEPRRALFARLARGRERIVHAHQVVRVGFGFVVRRLRAVRAVFRTAAALDVQEHAALHFVLPVMFAVDGLRAQQQVEQRRGVDGFDLGDGPVVA